MKKKVVSVALAAAMTAGVLAGCGGSSSKETTAAPAAEKTEEKADVQRVCSVRLQMN